MDKTFYADNRIRLYEQLTPGSLLGSIGLSMAGVLCLAPILCQWMGYVIVPVFTSLKLNPGMFGSILALAITGKK